MRAAEAAFHASSADTPMIVMMTSAMKTPKRMSVLARGGGGSGSDALTRRSARGRR